MQGYCVSLLGNSSPWFMTHTLSYVGEHLHSFRCLASQMEKNTHAQLQVSPIARRPPHHSGCAVQVMTTSEENLMQPPRRVTAGWR